LFKYKSKFEQNKWKSDQSEFEWIKPSEEFVTNENCEMKQSNKRSKTIHDKSLCASKVAEIRDLNIFPRVLQSVICTCESCRSYYDWKLQTSHYSCKPVPQQYVVLKKDNNKCLNGLYKWTATVVNVPKKCSCSTNKRSIDGSEFNQNG
jgi:hypothetical protein